MMQPATWTQKYVVGLVQNAYLKEHLRKKVNGSERINLFYIFLWHIQKPSLRPKRAIKWNESCTFFFQKVFELSVFKHFYDTRGF